MLPFVSAAGHLIIITFELGESGSQLIFKNKNHETDTCRCIFNNWLSGGRGERGQENPLSPRLVVCADAHGVNIPAVAAASCQQVSLSTELERNAC